MTTQTIPVDPSFVRTVSSLNAEPEWMTSLRLTALEMAERLELPKLEKTRIDRWDLDSVGQYRKPSTLTEAQNLPEQANLLLQTGENGKQLNALFLHRNSGASFSRLPDELAAQGVIFTDLATAVREHADLVRPYFMQAVKAEENRLTALHAATWSGGAFVYIPKNVVVEKPLQALFITDDEEALVSPHVLIVAEANSSVTYVENYLSVGGNVKQVHNGMVEIFAKDGARVQFASVHDLREDITDISYRRAVLHSDAKIEWVIGELNNGNTASETYSLLEGKGSESDAKVICVGTGKQNMNITTRARHIGMNTNSDMLTRAVMRDESTAIINGITKIEKGATFANGQQTEKVLMLSPQARGDANPMLLIDENEVKAYHAASIGKVDQDMIYYLMSRGISREQATRLIIYGFLAPIVEQIPIAKLEEQLKHLVERKLGQ
ncbi:MAG TPA: Fe-S cluster assembly protein SufD [Bacilli bacterium]